jgi:hypothetical protein
MFYAVFEPFSINNVFNGKLSLRKAAWLERQLWFVSAPALFFWL